MTTTRRDQNANFIQWEPVDVGDSPFTPCKPLQWYYEKSLSEADISLEDQIASEETIGLIRGRVAPRKPGLGNSHFLFQSSIPPASAVQLNRARSFRMTPPNATLRRLATRFPPPREWSEGEEEPPF